MATSESGSVLFWQGVLDLGADVARLRAARFQGLLIVMSLTN